MKNLILTFLLLFSTNLSAASKWNEEVRKLLPAKINDLKISQSTMKDVEKSFGKPQLVEDDNYYYEINGFKYGLQLIFNKNVLKEISYTFTSPTTIDLQKISLKPKDFKNSPADGHSYLKHADNSGDLVISVDGKRIYSVRLKK